MRFGRKAALIAMAAVVCLLAGSPAQASRTDGPVVEPPGLFGGVLIGEELRQVLGLPLDVNPANGADTCLFAGPVLLLWTRAESAPPPVCRVRPGTPVFFYALGGDCSNVEPDPFFGATEKAQRRCILGFLRETPFDAILVRVDGGRATSIGLDRFVAVSRQRSVFLPEPNILGVPGNRRATFVAAGYSAIVRSLGPGEHTITVTIVGGPFASTNRGIVWVGR
jgi:hypothetical protein